jgi:hypothetical protein
MIRFLLLGCLITLVSAWSSLDYCPGPDELVYDSQCQEPTCVCSGKGSLIEDNTCLCESPYGGLHCSAVRNTSLSCRKKTRPLTTDRRVSVSPYDSHLYRSGCDPIHGAIHHSDPVIHSFSPPRPIYVPEIGPFRILTSTSCLFRSNSSDPDLAFTFRSSGDDINDVGTKNARAFAFLLRPVGPDRPDSFTLHDALFPARVILSNGSLSRTYVERPPVFRLSGHLPAPISSFHLRSEDTGEYLVIDGDGVLTSSASIGDPLQMVFFDCIDGGFGCTVPTVSLQRTYSASMTSFRIAEIQYVRWYSACYSHCVRDRNCTALTYNNATYVCRLFNATNALHEIDDPFSTLIIPASSRSVSCPYQRFQPECGKDRLSYGPVLLTPSLQSSPFDDSVSIGSSSSDSVSYRLWRLEQVSQDANEYWIRRDIDGRPLIVNNTNGHLILDTEFRGVLTESWIVQEFCSITQRCSIGFGYPAAFCSAWTPNHCISSVDGAVVGRSVEGEWIDDGMTFTTSPYIGQLAQGLQVTSATELTIVGDSFGSDPGTKFSLECISICSRRDDCHAVSISGRNCHVATDVTAFSTTSNPSYQTWMKSLINGQTDAYPRTSANDVYNAWCENGGYYVDEDECTGEMIDLFDPPRCTESQFAQVSGFHGAGDVFGFAYDTNGCRAPTIEPVILHSSAGFAINGSYLGATNIAIYTLSRVDYDYWTIRFTGEGTNHVHIFSGFNGIYSIDANAPSGQVFLANRVTNPHPWRLVDRLDGSFQIESLRYTGLVLCVNSTGVVLSSSTSDASCILSLSHPDVDFGVYQETTLISSIDKRIDPTGTLVVDLLTCQTICLHDRRCTGASVLDAGIYVCYLSYASQVAAVSYGGSQTWIKPTSLRGQDCFIPFLSEDCSPPSLGAMRLAAVTSPSIQVDSVDMFYVVAIQQNEVRIMAINQSTDEVAAFRHPTHQVVQGHGLDESVTLLTTTGSTNWTDGSTAFYVATFVRFESLYIWLSDTTLILAEASGVGQLSSFADLEVETWPSRNWIIPEYDGEATQQALRDPAAGFCFDENALPNLGAVRTWRYTRSIDHCRAVCLDDPACAGTVYDPLEGTSLGNCTLFVVLKMIGCSGKWYWMRSAQFNVHNQPTVLDTLQVPIEDTPYGALVSVATYGEPLDDEDYDAVLYFMGITGNNGANPISSEPGADSYRMLYEVNIYSNDDFTFENGDHGCGDVDGCPQRSINYISDITGTTATLQWAYAPVDRNYTITPLFSTTQYFSIPIPTSYGNERFVRLITGIYSINSEAQPRLDDEGIKIWCAFNNVNNNGDEDYSNGQGLVGYMVPPEAIRQDECWYRITA